MANETQDLIKILPVYLERRSNIFVSENLLPVKTTEVYGTQVKTSALAINKNFDLLAICQTDKLLELGIIDITDCIYPEVYLENIYVLLHDDVIMFNVKYKHSSKFFTNEESQKLELLKFNEQIIINDTTKQVNNEKLNCLKITDGEAIIINVDMSGSLNTVTGYLQMNVNSFTFNDVADKKRYCRYKDILYSESEFINEGYVIGYDLSFSRYNTNKFTERKQNG